MSEKKVYFIHPSITYHSRTEKRCLQLIKSELGEDLEIINPSNLNKKQIQGWKEDLTEMDAVVGMALEEKYTVSVWTVLEHAEKLKKPVYTIRVNETITKWHEGVLEDVEKLPLEETRRFTREIIYEDGKGMFKGMIFGNRSKY
ncbi:MAG: hypothetical protein U9N35_04600 [Euryarchaeota archaeon]|nr:hypothetical protein [Euryarchaeota archaeon]